MTNNFHPPEKYIELLNNFCYKCERTFKNLEAGTKRELKEVIPVLFKKWFFSSIMDNTIVSPANILIWETGESAENNSFPDTDLCISDKKTGLYKYELRHHIVSIDDHPFIKDMKAFIDFCHPAIELDDNGLLKGYQKVLLKDKLSVTDKFYIDYIAMICLKLGLLVNMPSIFTKTYRPSDDSNLFFNKKNNDILSDIMLASLEICSSKIANDLVLPSSSFSPGKIYGYFQQCVPVNEMIKDIYFNMGFDIERLIEKCDSEIISAEDQSLLSSVNYVGHLIDKWYITPLSAYLRLIRPLYPMTGDLTDKLNLIADIFAIKGYADTEIFSPPNLYTLTTAGKYFSNKNRYEFDQTIPKDMPKNSIYDALCNSFMTDKFHFELEDFLACSRIIYSIKIRHMKNVQKWVVFEVDSDMTLSSLCMEILDAFELGEGYDYTFIKNTDSNLDVRFTYKHNRSGFNDPSSVSVGSVLSDKNERIYLYLPKITTKFVIELLRTDNGKSGILYPRPVRQSKLMDDSREKFD